MSELPSQNGDEYASRLLGYFLVLIVVILMAASTIPSIISLAENGTETSKASNQLSGHLPNERRDESQPQSGSAGMDGSVVTEEVSVGTVGNLGGQSLATAAAVQPGNGIQQLTSDDETLPLNSIRFDLEELTERAVAERAIADGQIRVQKSVFSGGSELGTLSITVDRYAQLFASKSDLEALLPQSNALSSVGEGTLVSFTRLRQSGINLRYDPVSDLIILEE